MTGQKVYLPVSFRKQHTGVVLGVSLLILWTLVAVKEPQEELRDVIDLTICWAAGVR